MNNQLSVCDVSDPKKDEADTTHRRRPKVAHWWHVSNPCKEIAKETEELTETTSKYLQIMPELKMLIPKTNAHRNPFFL